MASDGVRHRFSRDEAIELIEHADLTTLGVMADLVRRERHPDRVVTYIIDRNVNYTNVCVARCNFCAFYRPVGHGDGYVLSFDEIFRKIDETVAVGASRYSRSASAASTRCPASALATIRSSPSSMRTLDSTTPPPSIVLPGLVGRRRHPLAW